MATNGLTPAVLNKLPLGLLGFLGIKNGGVYPQQLIPTIAPTWDMLELFTGAHSEFRKVVPAIGGVGNILLDTVPDTEVWYLSEMGVRYVTPAGATIGATVVHGLPNAGTPPSIFLPLHLTVVLAASQALYGVQTRPVFLGPGEQILMDVTTFSGAPTATTTYRILRFQI